MDAVPLVLWGTHPDVRKWVHKRVELGRENGKVRPVDRFMKGRTTFVFDMTDLSAELPTTLLRSKEDCPKIQERMVGSINEDVLKRVTKIMSYLRPRERRKKDKKAKKPNDRDHEDAGGEGRDRAAPMDVAVEVEEKKPAEKAGVAPDLTDLMSLGFLKPAAKTNAQPKALEEDSYVSSRHTCSCGVGSKSNAWCSRT